MYAVTPEHLLPDVRDQHYAHQLFEAQVQRTPNAIAVMHASTALTYQELNSRANQLAHTLIRRGIDSDTLVGVSFSRSLNMLVALLGVWKAGAAYLPLDPGYPPARLDFMVQDAEPVLLLVDRQAQSLYSHCAVETLCLEDDWFHLSAETTDNPPVLCAPCDLAYVIYTSGSTGQPKGVMIEHRGLSNYLDWAIQAYGINADANIPVLSSLSFDLTITSLYPALLTGGRIELLPESNWAEHLIHALDLGHRYSLLKLTPSHLALLSHLLSPKALATLSQTLVIGGERLMAEQLALWRQHAPHTRLINEYGPTEAVVGCCSYEVAKHDPQHGPVPIGQPIRKTFLYILDANLQPVPDGTCGELYVGGAGVARGYLNHPQLTREKFLPDPFIGNRNMRMYRTGDLVKRRSDGQLEYLGRNDEQIKIRGYRIEPGEIENHLMAFPGMRTAAVLATDNASGESKLVACLVAEYTQFPSISDVRNFLQMRLPEHMLPERIILLAQLPLTLNGKVDRPALAALLASMAPDIADKHCFVAPRTEVERALSDIWCDVLALPRIGIDEDLFALGARSLQAARALARMREHFDLPLQLRHLFDQPSIAGMAGLIDQLNWLRRTQQPSESAAVREEIAL